MSMGEIRDKTFYSVVGFKTAGEWATFHKDNYVCLGNAKRVATSLKAKGFERVVVRREEIFLRNENNEFSSSTPLLVM